MLGDVERGHARTAVRRQLVRPARAGHLRDAVYGGIDGAVTTLAIVAGVAGAGLPSPVIVALGVANVLADGFSMAAGSFVATRAEHDNVRRLRAMERRQVRERPEGERLELAGILAAKGLSGARLEETVRVISRNEALWIDVMLLEEHGVAPLDAAPLAAALVTFAAFLVCGLVPLAPFLAGVAHPLAASVAATAVVFLLIGGLRGRFSLGSSWRAAGETLAIGAIAGLVAWGASVVVAGLSV